MTKYFLPFIILLLFSCSQNPEAGNEEITVIRINQLGYLPGSVKVAVLASKGNISIESFSLHNAQTEEEVYNSKQAESKGAYGPFESSYRLNFSDFNTSGKYYLQAKGIKSPAFRIKADVYDRTADFLMEYISPLLIQ